MYVVFTRGLLRVVCLQTRIPLSRLCPSTVARNCLPSLPSFVFSFSSSNKATVDQSKLIAALEDSVKSKTDPKETLENVKNLITLKQAQHDQSHESSSCCGEIHRYPNFEQDLFILANAEYGLSNFAACEATIEQIITSQTISPPIKTRTLLLKSSLFQHVYHDYSSSRDIALSAQKTIQEDFSPVGIELKVTIAHMLGELYLNIFNDESSGKQYIMQAVSMIESEIDMNYLLPEQVKGQYSQRLASCLDSLAELADKNDDYEACKAFMGRCIILWQTNTFKQPFQYANSLLRQARISQLRGELIQAIEKYTRATKLMTGYENSDQFILLCLYTSETRRGQGKYDLAVEAIVSAQEQLSRIREAAKSHYEMLIADEYFEVLMSAQRFTDARSEITKQKHTNAFLHDQVFTRKILNQELLVLICLDELQPALEVAQQLLELSTHDKQEQADLLVTYGITQIRLNLIEEGFLRVQQACEILRGINQFSQVQEVWNQVVEIFDDNSKQPIIPSLFLVRALKELRHSIEEQIKQSPQRAAADPALDFITKKIEETQKIMRK